MKVRQVNDYCLPFEESYGSRPCPSVRFESDIKFPTSPTVTVEKTTQADEKEADDEEDASRRRYREATMRRRMTVMEILRPLMIRRIQNPQMKRMAIPAMRTLPDGDTEKDDAQKDDSNGDTASSDDKKDTESSDEKDGDSGNVMLSDKSGT